MAKSKSPESMATAELLVTMEAPQADGEVIHLLMTWTDAQALAMAILVYQ